MTKGRSIKDLKGKTVVNVTTGENLAKVADTMIDSNSTRVAAVVIQVGDFLQPEYQYIQSDDVQVWGSDVILVRGDDVLIPAMDVADRSDWLKTSDYLRRRTVLDANGTRLGLIGDIFIDTEGRFTGYRMSQVNVEGPLSESKYIPASATQSVGPDYVIVDTGRFEPGDLAPELDAEAGDEDRDDDSPLFGDPDNRL